MAGLFAARALARKNWNVTVFEPDPSAVGMTAEEAFEGWRRPGVAQIRQPHSIRAFARNLLKERDSELLQDILASGAVEWNFAVRVGEKPDPSDNGELISILGRRTTYEAAVRECVEKTPGVGLVRSYVKDILIDTSGSHPRISGLRTDDGRVFTFDQVVDASGRRSSAPQWFEKAGLGRPAEVAQEAGLIYYSRHFRLRPGANPRGSGYRAAPSGSVPFVSYFANKTDRGTFSALAAAASWEPRFKTLKDPAVFNAFVATLPGLDEWLDPKVSEPISKVMPYGGIYDRRWTFTKSDKPLLHGFYVVGDARVHTCPFYGWGMTLGLVQSYILADGLEEKGDLDSQMRIERRLEEHSTTYYEAAAGEDGARSASWLGELPKERAHYAFFISTLQPAAARDASVYFSLIRRTHLVDHPECVFEDEAICDRARAVMAGVPASTLTREEIFARFAAAEKLRGTDEAAATLALVK